MGKQASIWFLSFIHDKMEKHLRSRQNCPLGVVQMDGSLTSPKHYSMFNIDIIEAREYHKHLLETVTQTWAGAYINIYFVFGSQDLKVWYSLNHCHRVGWC